MSDNNKTYMPFDSLPEPGDQYKLGDIIGTGANAIVYKATDSTNNNKIFAIKIQPYDETTKDYIDKEYKIYKDYSGHPNVPDFYGTYRKKVSNGYEVWFILQFCEGGSAIDLVKRLETIDKRMTEKQLAYVLRETAKAAVHLHDNHFIHRDIRGNNILITQSGEVKLCDYGLSNGLYTEMGKRSTCIGSPYWMAPEVVSSTYDKYDESLIEDGVYGNRIDVWSLGITAIELADGVPPFNNMHPTRALFQIVRNPPPTLIRPSNWTNEFNDFIAECLEKSADNRPFMAEILEHPFLTQLTAEGGSDYHFTTELAHYVEIAGPLLSANTSDEICIKNGFMKKMNCKAERMYMEDLAALEKINEDTIIDQLRHRFIRERSYSFIGDVLLSLNTNNLPEEFPNEIRSKFVNKSRSENSPHIFAVADSAYQDMLHHEETQNIVFAGESYSGKTTNMKHVMRQLCFLGNGTADIESKVFNALFIIHSLVNAGTPLNPDSTRCASQTQLTFGKTGRISGAIFWIYLLEKLRVSSTDMNHSNFHIFYYFYDMVKAENKFNEYQMNPKTKYRYLRIPNEKLQTKLQYHHDDPLGNVKNFEKFENCLDLMTFSECEINTIKRILAAILLMGEIRFIESTMERETQVENVELVTKICTLLNVDERKFQWSLINYCIVRDGKPEKRKLKLDEARDTRDILANTMYMRLVDWIVNVINQKFIFPRQVFGDVYMIQLIDIFGFECFHRNRTEQLIINSLNEQMQYHYNQRMFKFEMMEQAEEGIPVTRLHYYDNKVTVDHLMSKPMGLFNVIDDATRGKHSHEFITDVIGDKQSTHIQRINNNEITIAHFTGKVTYDTRSFMDKNRDFLPPEMYETLRRSKDDIVKLLFTNQLSKTGNLTMSVSETSQIKKLEPLKQKSKKVAMCEKQSKSKLNTLSQGQYSQVHKMRTLSSVFRATCLEILKGISVGGSCGYTHFVRCIRADLDYKPLGFHEDMIRQQLRALAVPDTAIARQQGYQQRISVEKFLKRYQFLAFDFDEQVDLTIENCRLLLLRLKMEGWALGKTKVFLTYYNEEYLARLYATQVKKIIKVQSMMRSYLARKRANAKAAKQDKTYLSDDAQLDNAALVIQKAYRGYESRKKYAPLINARTGKINYATKAFLKKYTKSWQKKTIYQVLVQYRAARVQDFINFSQQIHLYNQRVITGLRTSSMFLDMEKINHNQTNPSILGKIKQPVRKMPFSLHDIPYYERRFLCDPENPNYVANRESDDEDWDTPIQKAFDRSQLYNSKIKCSTRKTKAPSPPSYEKNFNNYDNNNNNDDDDLFKNQQKKSSTITFVERDGSFSKKRQAPQPNKSDNEHVHRVNPVKEMQMIAQMRGSADNNDDNTDPPPFNFQGMLRKTNFNPRDSLKRVHDTSQQHNQSVDFSQHQPQHHHHHGIMNNKSNSYNNLKMPPQIKIESYENKSGSLTNYSSANTDRNCNRIYEEENYKSTSTPIINKEFNRSKDDDLNNNNIILNNNNKSNNSPSYTSSDGIRTNLTPKSIWDDDFENIDHNGVFIHEEIRPGIILEGLAVII